MTLSHGLNLLGGLSAMILLTSCQTPTTATTDPACLALETITFSASQDSPSTIRQIRQHNAALRALCQPEG